MATYKESGVDIEKGDSASELAYSAAKATFQSRKGMIGEPISTLEGSFTGALDFGDFYLVQNDDGIGTKVEIAEMIGKYDTLGRDLLAMVADDAVCAGAEVISISNTIDTNKVDPQQISKMMQGLSKACCEQKIVIPGGEIAELADACNGIIWNATAIGIVEKDKLITGKTVQVGDQIIGLLSHGFRSNGFTLVRHILRGKFGKDWAHKEFEDGKTWGEATLTPCIIYHDFILSMIGRYKEPRKINIKAVAHITGGGLPGNLPRVIPSWLGADLNNLPPPPRFMSAIAEFGHVSRDEAFRTWNMGIGMCLIVSPSDVSRVLETAKSSGIDGQLIGEIIGKPGIHF